MMAVEIGQGMSFADLTAERISLTMTAIEGVMCPATTISTTACRCFSPLAFRVQKLSDCYTTLLRIFASGALVSWSGKCECSRNGIEYLGKLASDHLNRHNDHNRHDTCNESILNSS